MDIYEKLKKVEALIDRGASEGERQAAMEAKQRLLERVDSKPIEYTITNDTYWKKKLFVAICSKYGLKTYRYKRQKYSTAMVRVSRAFMDQVLWPEFDKLANLFNEMVKGITEDLIARIHHGKEGEVIVAGEIPT